MTVRRIAILDETGMLPAEVLPASQGAPAPHPDLTEHEALGLATNADLAAHFGTAHGLASHAIDGAYHSGSEVLPTQGQRNALAGTAGQPGIGNEYVTTQDPRNADARTPTAHAHSDADIAATVARDAEVTSAISTHAATPHGGGAGPWTAVIKTADESKNLSIVVADDATLKFTTLPNTNYTIRLRAWFLTNATADLKYRLFHAGTTTRVRRMIVRTATADIPAHVTTGLAFDAADVILSTTGLNPYLSEDVILQVGAAGGLFVLRWSQVTSGPGPTTCLEGSYLEYAVT